MPDVQNHIRGRTRDVGRERVGARRAFQQAGNRGVAGRVPHPVGRLHGQPGEYTALERFDSALDYFVGISDADHESGGPNERKKYAYLAHRGRTPSRRRWTTTPNAELLPYGSIPAAIAAAASGEADEAVAPIENSIEGVVTYTVDLPDTRIVAEDKGRGDSPDSPLPADAAGRAHRGHPGGLFASAGDSAVPGIPEPPPAERRAYSLAQHGGAVEDMNPSRYPAAAISSRGRRSCSRRT